jgi:hypothetical protein
MLNVFPEPVTPRDLMLIPVRAPRSLANRARLVAGQRELDTRLKRS